MRKTIVLSLLVAILGGLVGSSGPAQAVVSVASTGTTTIPYSGTVQGPPEDVHLSGSAQISFKVVRDLDFGKPPSVLLTIDMSRVSGVGAKSGLKYVTSGGQNLLRPLVAVDQVDITFAFFPSGRDGSSQARSALASFTLTYDLGAERLSQGSASSEVTPVKE